MQSAGPYVSKAFLFLIVLPLIPFHLSFVRRAGQPAEHEIVGVAVDGRFVGAGIGLLRFEGGERVGSTACDLHLQLH